ncbi:MAG TPA: M48 family metallopeptidase [Anaerolineales bacterium]|nr:M48 family metallopeptidase [Anaerolineales bacterium]
MAGEQLTIRDANNQLIQVSLRRDKRLRRTSRWERMSDGSLLVRIPYRIPTRNVSLLLEQISKQLEKSIAKQKRHNDIDLNQRAEQINQKYFNGKITWNTIRWVNNMQTRLGSCSRGGPTDGEIRINAKIRNWPVWVVNYVIAHELMHRKHPNHSRAFWAELRATYPLTERARGFIHGIGFARGQRVDEEADEQGNH